jgi:hypothetical protein
MRLDEYELISYLNTKKEQVASTQIAPQAGSAVQPFMGSVVGALSRLRPAIPIRDLDSKYASLRAYCQSGKQRLALIQSVLGTESTASLSKSILDKVPALRRDFASVLSGNPLAPESDYLKLSALDEQFVCSRNREWEEDMQLISDGRRHFYAVGARHLFPVQHTFAQCPGLLEDLRMAGYRVEKIKL